MAITNNNKKQVDLPVWEGLNFFPAANSAISEMTCVETPDTRYMYMLVSSLFWRYDTYTDVWESLAPPVTAPLLIASLKYLPYGGYLGQVISATSTTITGAFLQANMLVGKTVRIYAGTGAGQEKVISACSEPIIYDKGTPTTGAASSITDTLKKWEINRWSGYMCKLVNGVGVTQYRKILYNSATVLTFQDNNWQGLAPQENQPFVTAPTTASTYTIEANTLTVPTWDTTPDGTSKYRILTGLIALSSTTSSAPFQTYQVYDILSNIWITRSAQQGHLLAAGAVANDISFHRLDEGESGNYDTGTATVTGSSTTTLGDTTKTWTVDQYANYELKITGGAGRGTRKRILGNTASVLYVDGAITTPDTTSTYVIRPYRSQHFFSGWALASMLNYDSDADQWAQSFKSDNGIANIMSVSQANGGPTLACTATRAVNGIKTIVAAPTNGGSGYTVGDVLTCNQTGTGGLLVVTSTGAAGAVTGLRIQKCGTNYAVAAGRTTTGGTGTNCTFEITALGTIGTITTANSHNFQIGESVTFKGADVATAAWNATYTILGTSSNTVFDVETTAAGTAVALTAQANNVIVDATKTWTVNEHAGKLVTICLLGTAPTSQTRRIATNTATALTLYGAVLSGAATEGRDRYIIYDVNAFGRAQQEENPARQTTGWATSGSGTTLVDNTKSWKGNQWVGYKVKVICGTGYDKVEVAITSNTETTLTVSGGYGFTPDTTSKYIIQDTFGIPTTVTNTTNAVITDTSKLWPVNQWAGFRVRITGGEGTGQEATITSNTATALTITGVFTTAPVANSSTYTILGVPARGTGHELTWAAKTTVSPGRYIYSPRGSGTNIIDRFDITKNTWHAAWVSTPDTETLNLGTMYAYDGLNRIYFQKDATGKLFHLDLTTYRTEASGFVPYTLNSSIGTAVNGNRMEIIQTTDGLKYLYIMKHTGAALSATGGGTEMYRTLIFY